MLSCLAWLMNQLLLIMNLFKIKDSSFMDTWNKKSPNKYSYSRSHKIRQRLEKFQNKTWNATINEDDDYFQAQQKIVSSFRMTSKFILT